MLEFRNMPIRRRAVEGRRETKKAFEFDTDWYDRFVDPADRFVDDDGTRWEPLGGAEGTVPYRTAQELAAMRDRSRQLFSENEFAINALTNRKNYTIGTGFSYTVASKKRREPAPPDLLEAVQDEIDDFSDRNRLAVLEPEFVVRSDRDGEGFWRKFVIDRRLAIRVVEPSEVYPPPERPSVANSFGVVSDERDQQAVIGFWVGGEFVPSIEILHNKMNVDDNVPRGVPTLYPVDENLRRIEKLLRGISRQAGTLCNLALIRKIDPDLAPKSVVQSFIANRRTGSITSMTTGRTLSFTRVRPGTVLTSLKGLDYEFPASKAPIDKWLLSAQADLRAVASRMIMPEFMFTSDASNAAYASTMVAEGPAVRNFETLQALYLRLFVDLRYEAVQVAIDAGRLPPDTFRQVIIGATAPPLTVRDREKETKRYSLMYAAGVISKKTWRLREGLEPDEEEANISDEIGGMGPLPEPRGEGEE